MTRMGKNINMFETEFEKKCVRFDYASPLSLSSIYTLAEFTSRFYFYHFEALTSI